MAISRYMGVPVQSGIVGNVTVAGSTTSAAVELQVDEGLVGSKAQLLRCLEQIKAKIIMLGWPLNT